MRGRGGRRSSVEAPFFFLDFGLAKRPLTGNCDVSPVLVVKVVVWVVVDVGLSP